MKGRFFFPLWWDLLGRDFREGKYGELIPWKLGICLGISFSLFFFVDFCVKSNFVLNALLAILTATGILAAITINSIQQVLSNISHPGFSSYLEENDVLCYYLFFIMYFQGIMVIALFIIVITIILFVIDVQYVYRFISASISVASFLYSLVQAIASTILVRYLIYYRSKFELKEHSTD
jgi:hypothetical protein